MAQLPERVSLEYLKKLAKDRLRDLRRGDPAAKLAAAQLAVARDYGFASWRVLKAEVHRRAGGDVTLFFDACARGATEALRRLLDAAPDLVRAANPAADHGGWTGLHTAAHKGQFNVVRMLLERGADPNAREEGDNTYPLHWAAAHRRLEVVRALLDAGGDVHGFGDVHELDTIGWATFFHDPSRERGHNPEVAALLIERGARHHIFSAMSIGDLDLIRGVIEQDPKALDRRMSRFEHGLSPLHFALQEGRYDIVDLLLSMGCDVDMQTNGETALESSMLAGNRQAIDRLRAAGAREPARIPSGEIRNGIAALADSVNRIVPMIYVPDVGAALDWYVSIGFREVARYGDDGAVNFGVVGFGKTEILINMHGKKGKHDISLWFSTDHIDELYELLKSRQFAAVAGETNDGIEFEEHINDTFYRARQFAIRDLNGYVLYFIQDLK